MNDNLKGPLYTVISAILLTFSFISITYLLRSTNPETLNFVWWGTALLVSFVIATVMRIKWVHVVKKYWKVGFILGILIGGGAGMMFHAIKVIGPSLSSFLVRFVLPFTIILGVIFLKERFNRWEALGMVIAVVGAFTINFVGGENISLGSLLVILASVLFAIHGVLAKIYVKEINPLELIILRGIFLVPIVFIYAFLSGNLQPISLNLIVLTTFASTLSAVIGFIFFFRALQLMELTKLMIIRSLDPFLVVIYAFIFFSSVLTFVQIIGGSLIVAGVIITVVAQQMKKRLITTAPV